MPVRLLPNLTGAVFFACVVTGCSDSDTRSAATGSESIADPRVAAAVQSCIACHGRYGVSALEPYPNLAGQKRTYLLNQLRAYRSGERNNPVMTSLLQPYSDEVLVGLAEYYSRLPAGGPERQ